jgi:hypothetical protein
MTILTKEQEELFYDWIQKYVKDFGHDFVFGFFVVPVGTDKEIYLGSPEHDEWVETKKKEFLSEQNK